MMHRNQRSGGYSRFTFTLTLTSLMALALILNGCGSSKPVAVNDTTTDTGGDTTNLDGSLTNVSAGGTNKGTNNTNNTNNGSSSGLQPPTWGNSVLKSVVQVTLNWNNATGATQVIVEQLLPGATAFAAIATVAVSGATGTYTVASLSPMAVYYFRLR